MKPIVLAILDGWGHSTTRTGNAILSAQTPTLNEIVHNYPSMLLQASGPAVGMTFGESGNSEVGHMTLGGGRVIFQYLMRINKAIENGDFFTNPTLVEAAAHVQRHSSTLHIAGLLTSGVVHASFNHLVALVKFAKSSNIPYRLHLWTDGRDSGLKEGVDLLKKLSDEIGGLENLATVIGRDFAMDRNNNWDRTEATYNLIANAAGTQVSDIFTAMESYYQQNITDGAIPATVVTPSPLKSGDGVVFFNFREDSMRQIIRVFTEPGFDTFLKKVPDNLFITGMTQYLENPELRVIIPPPNVKNCLSEVLSLNGKKHLHVAETEKYAHVTFFFNGLRTKPFDGETDFFIESLENLTQHPQMRAADITQKVVAEMDRDFYDVFIVNYANGDMLAHLGILDAAVQGVQTVDASLATLKQKVLEKGGTLIITADHGNVESMIYQTTGDRETRHDSNPVPLYLVGAPFARPRSDADIAQSYAQVNGIIADVAPTILELLEIQKPVEMTGSSLLPILNH